MTITCPNANFSLKLLVINSKRHWSETLKCQRVRMTFSTYKYNSVIIIWPTRRVLLMAIYYCGQHCSFRCYLLRSSRELRIRFYSPREMYVYTSRYIPPTESQNMCRLHLYAIAFIRPRLYSPDFITTTKIFISYIIPLEF